VLIIGAGIRLRRQGFHTSLSPRARPTSCSKSSSSGVSSVTARQAGRVPSSTISPGSASCSEPTCRASDRAGHNGGNRLEFPDSSRPGQRVRGSRTNPSRREPNEPDEPETRRNPGYLEHTPRRTNPIGYRASPAAPWLSVGFTFQVMQDRLDGSLQGCEIVGDDLPDAPVLHIG
jgi:hypothetical protein